MNQLLAVLKEDLAAHQGDWRRPGFRAVATYRFGVWRLTVQSRILRRILTSIYKMMYRRVRDRLGIELDCSAKVGRRLVIAHQHGIVIHGNSVIGDDCLIHQGVTLGNKSWKFPGDAPHLGNRVNVGAGAKILGAVKIGDDAVIGANAVVLQDVPSGATAVGIPARIISR
jgi:serine acetyltransferase